MSRLAIILSLFITAAKKIGMKPVECLVIEDDLNGVKAGKSAGSKCLALLTSFQKEE